MTDKIEQKYEIGNIPLERAEELLRKLERSWRDEQARRILSFLRPMYDVKEFF